MAQHPFIDPRQYYENISNATDYLNKTQQGVTGSKVVRYAPDGTPAVYEVTYSDGTKSFEAPTSMGGKSVGGTDYNWMLTAPQEGSTFNSVKREIGDGGSWGETPLSISVTDPNAIQFERYVPQGLESTGSILGKLGMAALGAYGMGALGGLGEAAAGTAAAETGAMSIPGTYGAMSSTAALAPSVSALSASPLIGTELASGVAALSAAEPFYFDDWGRGSNAAGDMVDGAGNRAWQDVTAETLRDIGVPRDYAAKAVNGVSNLITDPSKIASTASDVSKFASLFGQQQQPQQGGLLSPSSYGNRVSPYQMGLLDISPAKYSKIFGE